MMLDSNEILDLELSCGKWTAEKQKEVLRELKDYHDAVVFRDGCLEDDE